MILGIGIDTIETSRVAREIARSGFRQRYFTAAEIAYCELKPFGARNYAARFAAKEALFKALGTGCRDGLSFLEVEVVNGPLGKPGIVLRGKTKELCRKLRIRRLHLSLTHVKDFSSAFVITER